MANFLDELRNRMAACPHVGPTPVTNPKVPTKVERDVAEFKVRQKAMPNFKFGTGTVLQQIKEHTEKCPHAGPIYADPAFNDEHVPLTPEVETWEAMYQSFEKIYKEKKSKQK